MVTAISIPKGFVVTNRGGGTVSGRVIFYAPPSLAAGGSATYAVVLRPIGRRAGKATITTTVSAVGAANATASATIAVRAAKKRAVIPVTGGDLGGDPSACAPSSQEMLANGGVLRGEDEGVARQRPRSCTHRAPTCGR